MDKQTMLFEVLWLQKEKYDEQVLQALLRGQLELIIFVRYYWMFLTVLKLQICDILENLN